MSGDERFSSRRGSRGQLSGEDHALWEHVARSVERTVQGKPRVPELGEAAAGVADRAAGGIILREEERLRNEVAATGRSVGYVDQVPPHKARGRVGDHPTRAAVPPLADFDRKAVRRIRRGSIEIDARIDLHGMRQDEAHGALRSFLHACQGRGLRWVLVITGKGRFGRDEDSSGHWSGAGSERGVLRRAVPRWLAEPDLRAITVSYTSAALHHGGEGALYVQLRARRGAGHEPKR